MCTWRGARGGVQVQVVEVHVDVRRWGCTWRRCWWSAGAGGGDTNAGGVQVAEVQVQVGGGAGGGGAGGGGAGGGSTR